MPSLTGLELVTGSFQLLNVFLPGEAIPDADAQYALTAANDLLSEWSQRRAMIPVVARLRFDLVDGTPAGKGGPTNPYSIGPGGDFDTIRPANQKSITMANLVLTSPGPPNEVRVPLGIYTDDGYDANQLPGMLSGQPTDLYYNPTYANDRGSIYLWPVPNTDRNDLELFIEQPIAQFDDLSTVYFVPPGLPRALKFNVAQAIQGTYGREMSARQDLIAASSLGTFKRSNTKLTDLMNDIQIQPGRAGIWNIQTGSWG